MKTVIFGQTELRPESLLENGVSVASASKTDESTGVVWKFPVKMGDSETKFKVVSPNGTTDEIIILPL